MYAPTKTLFNESEVLVNGTATHFLTEAEAVFFADRLNINTLVNAIKVFYLANGQKRPFFISSTSARNHYQLGMNMTSAFIEDYNKLLRGCKCNAANVWYILDLNLAHQTGHLEFSNATPAYIKHFDLFQSAINSYYLHYAPPIAGKKQQITLTPAQREFYAR